MGSAGTIAMIVGVLAITFVLIAGLYPGAGAAWDTFSETVQAFPQFRNPFDETISSNPPLVADGDNSPEAAWNNGTVENCDESDSVPYWGCVVSADGEDSYLSTPDGDNQFNVRYDNIPTTGSLPVLHAIVSIECRATVNGTFTISILDSTLGVRYSSPTVRCVGPWAEFIEMTVSATFVSIRPTVTQMTNGYIAFVGDTGEFDVSYLSVSYVIGAENECSSADSLAYVGCLISSFFGTVVRGIRFVINGLIFTGQIVAWLFSVVAAFLGVVSFLFTLPDAPPIVQAVITGIVIALLVVVVLVIVGMARGSEG